MTPRNFNTFTYQEKFGAMMLAKIPENLKITSLRTHPLVTMIRVLSGTASIIHHYNETEIYNKVNYFNVDFKVSKNKWHQEFPLVISTDVSILDISLYIQAIKNTNITFYKNILTEVSQFIVHTKRKSHTSAFIYIYRMLERLSYAFPLIYSQKSSDYMQSFSQLKNMMSGDRDKSELGFFKVFLKKILEDSDLKETSVDILIGTDNLVMQDIMYKSMKSVCSDDMIHEDTQEPRKLSIKFENMGDFVISIRNRFFHYRNESGNLDSDRLVDSDEFFNCLNKYALQWICSIFILMFSHNLSDFQSMVSENKVDE
ncbi:hypothetical protein ACLMPP_00740 [Yersinia enterocolitica]|uniref:hypothetical protein n=1 Tax=Yersinia enterocolitica TaxID=630 RepID=UPI00398C8322